MNDNIVNFINTINKIKLHIESVYLHNFVIFNLQNNDFKDHIINYFSLKISIDFIIDTYTFHAKSLKSSQDTMDNFLIENHLNDKSLSFYSDIALFIDAKDVFECIYKHSDTICMLNNYAKKIYTYKNN